MSGNKFYKGRTNNHLSWVMVDATDFATPESALSAATKIKIYGKVKSGTGVNFVSSGTGSLTNDIQHVGASALGIYTIALAKADLSDASAAWYDQYIISLSATGAAYQTLIVDGGINDSYLSDVASYLSNMESNLSAVVSDIRSDVSDMHSDLIVMSGILSDTYSLLVANSDAISNAYSAAAQTKSRVLLVQSRLSELDSRIASEMSDMYSLLSDHHSTMNSQFTWLSNAISDAHSDIYSAIGNVSVAISASDISDIASAVAAAIGFTPAGIASKVWSDYESRIGTTASDAWSKVVLGQSRVSDIQSYLVAMSGVQSDIYSAISDLHSDFGSRVPKAVATNSQLSDLASDLKSYLVGLSATLSDVDSAVSSQFAALSGMVSDVHSAATLINTNRAEPGQGAPAATITALEKLDYLYKAWRNKKEQTSSEFSLYADDGTTVDQKATTSDNGTTATVGEMVTGA